MWASLEKKFGLEKKEEEVEKPVLPSLEERELDGFFLLLDEFKVQYPNLVALVKLNLKQRFENDDFDDTVRWDVFDLYTKLKSIEAKKHG